MRGFVRLVALTLLAGGGAGRAVLAQVRASERGTVSQTIDGAVVTVNYSRPRLRGRTPLFGKVVHWGEVWTPGANWATTLELSREVRLDGHPIPKGKYSVWFVVQPEEWTLILDPRVHRYHTEIPDSIAGQFRWTVRPAVAPPTEVLTWGFPDLRPGGGVLQMEWATTRVSINVAVPPRHPLTIARTEIEPYLGRYRLNMSEAVSDSGVASEELVELVYEDGSLKARFDQPPPWYPSLQGSIMVRINDDWFIPTIVRNGEVLEMVADAIFEFTVADGRAVAFEVRDDHDVLLGRGHRVSNQR